MRVRSLLAACLVFLSSWGGRLGAVTVWTGDNPQTPMRWSASGNWSGNALPTGGSTVEFFTGETLPADKLSIVRDLASSFDLNVLTLGGNGPISGTGSVEFTGSALRLIAIGNARPVVNLAASNGAGLGFTLQQALNLGTGTSFQGNGTASFTISGPISGPGSLTKAGASTLILAGANSYAGSTLVSEGALVIDGVHSDGESLTVATNARLAGSGSIAGLTTIGGIHEPGLPVRPSPPTTASAPVPIRNPLMVPTPDGVLTVTHPSVQYFPNLFNGWKYWMAFTPYPDARRENPCLVVSQDGVNWETPAGVTNPLARPVDAQAIGNQYWSDPSLVRLPSGTLALFYRGIYGWRNESVVRKTSTDGITWSATQVVLSNPAGYKMISPSIVVEPDNKLAMFAVDDSIGKITRRISTDNGVTWATPENCAFPPSLSPWHLDVQISGTVHWAMVLSKGPKRLYIYSSTDGGLTWQGANTPFFPLTGDSFDARGNYKSCFVPLPGEPQRFTVWVVGVDLSGQTDFDSNHRMAFYNNVDFTAPFTVPTAPTVTLPVTTIPVVPTVLSLGAQTFNGPLNYASSARLHWELGANSSDSADANQAIVNSAPLSIASGAKVDVVLNRIGGHVDMTDAFWREIRTWNFVASSSTSGAFTLGDISPDVGGRDPRAFGSFTVPPTTENAALVWTPFSPYELWQRAHFPALNATSQPDADADGDGISNIDEFNAGTDPLNASDRLRPPLARGAGNARFDLPFPAHPNRTYILQRATSLANPVWIDLGTTTATDDLSMVLSDPSPPSGSAFYRLKVARGEMTPFEVWRTTTFGARSTDGTRAGPNADPDGDGASNLDEFIAGTDPLDARQCLPSNVTMTKAASSQGYTLQFPARSSHRYTLQRSTSLADPVWTEVASVVSITNATMTLTDPSPPAGSAFYRVLVGPP